MCKKGWWTIGCDCVVAGLWVAIGRRPSAGSEDGEEGVTVLVTLGNDEGLVWLGIDQRVKSPSEGQPVSSNRQGHPVDERGNVNVLV